MTENKENHVFDVLPLTHTHILSITKWWWIDEDDEKENKIYMNEKALRGLLTV